MIIPLAQSVNLMSPKNHHHLLQLPSTLDDARHGRDDDETVNYGEGAASRKPHAQKASSRTSVCSVNKTEKYGFEQPVMARKATLKLMQSGLKQSSARLSISKTLRKSLGNQRTVNLQNSQHMFLPEISTSFSPLGSVGHHHHLLGSHRLSHWTSQLSKSIQEAKEVRGFLNQSIDVMRSDLQAQEEARLRKAQQEKIEKTSSSHHLTHQVVAAALRPTLSKRKLTLAGDD